MPEPELFAVLRDYGILSYTVGMIDGADGIVATRMDLIGLSREQVREKREEIRVRLRKALEAASE